MKFIPISYCTHGCDGYGSHGRDRSYGCNRPDRPHGCGGYSGFECIFHACGGCGKRRCA